MTAAGRYARILGAPHVPSMMAATFVGRLPIGIQSLAIILFARDETGSYASAGAVAALFAAGTAFGAPFQGRLVDRHGQRRVLVPLALIHAGALSAMVAVGLSGAGPVAMAALALPAGICLPPMSSVMRAMWPHLLRDRTELLTAAFMVDSVLIEMVFVIGPLITAALVVVFAPAVAVLTGCGLLLAGTAWFVSLRPSREWSPVAPAGKRPGPLGALSSPGLRTLVVSIVPFGFCFGALEVTLPAFAEAEGDRALAGVLLAVWSAGSAVGGLAYGAREWSDSLASRFATLALIPPVFYFALMAATSIPLMALLVIPAGMCIAPLLGTGNQLAGEVAPPGTATEAYTWPITALVVGIASGNAVAGALAEAGSWRDAILAAAVATVVGAIAVHTRRHTLVPAAAPA